MPSVSEHYESHLAPLYSWALGGMDTAIARGERELDEIGLLAGNPGYAVDLGAGFGMHAIPLARKGWQVLAVDASSRLLGELKTHPDGASVTALRGDLLDFARYLSGTPNVVLCMGDTLTHLPDRATVRALIEGIATHLPPGGRFVATFRDYSSALEGRARFVPVRSDDSRILTCFLEYAEDFVRVHDILHERASDGWGMRVSDYRKLRLAPEWVKEQLETCGFAATLGTAPSGMVRVVGYAPGPRSSSRTSKSSSTG